MAQVHSHLAMTIMQSLALNTCWVTVGNTCEKLLHPWYACTVPAASVVHVSQSVVTPKLGSLNRSDCTQCTEVTLYVNQL